MATYYVRQTVGSDSNNGLSAGSPWATLGKALGATGILPGDTVWVGAGVYRESVTLAFNTVGTFANNTAYTVGQAIWDGTSIQRVSIAGTSATSGTPSWSTTVGNTTTSGTVTFVNMGTNTYIYGDPTGAYTGDAGEVRWTGNYYSDQGGSPVTPCVSLSGRNYLTIANFLLHNAAGGGGENILWGGGEKAITIARCYLTAERRDIGALSIIVNANNNAGHIVEDCYFMLGAAGISITGALHTSDYNMNITIRRCVMLCNGGAYGHIYVGTSGSGAGKPGGVTVDQVTALGISDVLITSGTSTTFPCVLRNTLARNHAILATAGALGQVTDGGGNLGDGYTNVTTSVDSFASYAAWKPFSAIVSMGHEHIWGLPTRPAFSMYPGQMMRVVIGETSSTTNIAGRSIWEGCRVGDTGTASSATTTTIVTSTKAWGTNEWAGWLIRTTGGTGSGQVKMIASNTATTLTISAASTGAGGLWATTPDNTTTYIIYQGPAVETGKATAGGTNTLTDSNASWNTSKWVGYTLEITSGQGSGQTRTISSMTSTVLTVSSNWTTQPNNTSVYAIYRGSLTAFHGGPGAFTPIDTGEIETSVVNDGSMAIRLVGWNSHEFQIPVTANVPITIGISGRFDTNHGTTTRPQAILLAAPELGVVTETKTMTAAADTWEALSFSPITPTGNGVVVVRLQARSSAPYGIAYFDTFALS